MKKYINTWKLDKLNKVLFGDILPAEITQDVEELRIIATDLFTPKPFPKYKPNFLRIYPRYKPKQLNIGLRQGGAPAKIEFEGTLSDILTINGNNDLLLDRLTSMIESGNTLNLDIIQSLKTAIETKDKSEIQKQPFTTKGENYDLPYYQHLTQHKLSPFFYGMQRPVEDNDKRCLEFLSYLMLCVGIEHFISIERAIKFKPLWLQMKMLCDYTNDSNISFQEIRIRDFNESTLEQAMDICRLVEKQQVSNSKTAIHCSAGFGRTGAVMWLIGCYQQCIITKGEYIKRPPPTTPEDFSRLADFINSFYPNEHEDPSNPDSAAKELTSVKAAGRIILFCRRWNVMVEACGRIYLENNKVEEPIQIKMYLESELDPENMDEMKKWYFETPESIATLTLDPVMGGKNTYKRKKKRKYTKRLM